MKPYYLKLENELPGIKAGEIVEVVKEHPENDCVSVKSMQGVLQCMVHKSNFSRSTTVIFPL